MVAHETHDEHEQGAEPARRNWPLRIAKWIGFTVLGIVAARRRAAAGPQHRVGQTLQSPTRSRDLNSKTECRSRSAGSKDRSIPRWCCTTLRSPIREARSLTSPEIAVDWRPFVFLDNHVDIRSAIAEADDAAAPSRVPRDARKPTIRCCPDLDIDIGRLRIDRFVAEAPVSGERRVARLAGEAHISDGRAQVALNGAVLGETGGDPAGAGARRRARRRSSSISSSRSARRRAG